MPGLCYCVPNLAEDGVQARGTTRLPSGFDEHHLLQHIQHLRIMAAKSRQTEFSFSAGFAATGRKSQLIQRPVLGTGLGYMS